MVVPLAARLAMTASDHRRPSARIAGKRSAWTPRGIHPIAGARSIGDGYFEIVVQPGAVAGDVVVALDAIPFDAAFVEVHDDIDTVLIFTYAPPAAVAARSGTPDAPEPQVLVTAA
jgi:uncharacterized repeat protein (TIGR03917 family)